MPSRTIIGVAMEGGVVDEPTETTPWIEDRRLGRRVAALVLVVIGCAAIALFLFGFWGRVLLELITMPWQVYVFIFLPLALVYLAHHIEKRKSR